MIRRLCAAFVLAALATQTGVSLYACQRGEGAGEHGAGAHQGGPAVHAGSHHGAGTRVADEEHAGPTPSGAVCNRHHPGRCPHAAAGALHRCTSDPADGLRAAAEAGPPAAVVLAVPPPPPLPLAASSLPPRPHAPPAAPELPPPRV